MTINHSSRYTQGEQLWLTTTGRGNKATVYLNTVTVLNTPYSVALVRETDSMMLYAQGAYQDPRRWWAIADANPQCFYPLDTRPGQALRIPS